MSFGHGLEASAAQPPRQCYPCSKAPEAEPRWERDADRMPNPNLLELCRKADRGANLYLGPAAKGDAFVKSEQKPLIQTSPLFRDSKLE